MSRARADLIAACQPLVLTPDAEKATVLVGRIVGDYEYRDDAPITGHQHVRRVTEPRNTAERVYRIEGGS